MSSRASYSRRNPRSPDGSGMQTMDTLIQTPQDAVTQTPPATSKIRVRNLNFYYGTYQALTNVDLQIAEKRITAFIGPSGCGKSTLLRIFNRMYDLYPGHRATGEIMLNDNNILDPAPGRDRAAGQSWDGVPEADAVPDVDLRKHRLRRQIV